MNRKQLPQTGDLVQVKFGDLVDPSLRPTGFGIVIGPSVRSSTTPRCERPGCVDVIFPDKGIMSWHANRLDVVSIMGVDT